MSSDNAYEEFFTSVRGETVISALKVFNLKIVEIDDFTEIHVPVRSVGACTAPSRTNPQWAALQHVNRGWRSFGVVVEALCKHLQQFRLCIVICSSTDPIL